MTPAVESRPDSQRIVITGVDAVTPLGLTLEDSVQSLEYERHGFSRISEVIGQRYNSSIDVAGLIPGFNPDAFFNHAELTGIHESAQIFYASAARTLHQAGYIREVPPPFKGNAEDFIGSMYPDSKGNPPKDPTLEERFRTPQGSDTLIQGADNHKFGIMPGTGVGGTPYTAQVEDLLVYRRLKERFGDKLSDDELKELFETEGGKLMKNPSAKMILQVLPERVATVTSNKVGLRGPGDIITAACASSLIAMGLSADQIKLGYAERMLTGGSEKGTDRIGLVCFDTMHALMEDLDPAEASRPYDEGHKGFVMSDATATLALESLESAKRRGAYVFAEILGYANNLDAHHDTAPRPQGEGAVETMNLALERAGLTPDNIDDVNSHGTSTPGGDLTELIALLTVFGAKKLKEMPVIALKGWMGHSLGASSAVEVALEIAMARRGFLVGNRNIVHPIMEGVNLMRDGNIPFPRRRRFLKNSFGFGGINASMVIETWDDSLQTHLQAA